MGDNDQFRMSEADLARLEADLNARSVATDDAVPATDERELLALLASRAPAGLYGAE